MARIDFTVAMSRYIARAFTRGQISFTDEELLLAQARDAPPALAPEVERAQRKAYLANLQRDRALAWVQLRCKVGEDYCVDEAELHRALDFEFGRPAQGEAANDRLPPDTAQGQHEPSATPPAPATTADAEQQPRRVLVADDFVGDWIERTAREGRASGWVKRDYFAAASTELGRISRRQFLQVWAERAPAHLRAPGRPRGA